MNKEKLGQEAAFPELTTEYDGKGNILPFQTKGMSKRFYAACAAMQGLLANEIYTSEHTSSTIEWIAKHSLLQADELLKQENE